MIIRDILIGSIHYDSKLIIFLMPSIKTHGILHKLFLLNRLWRSLDRNHLSNKLHYQRIFKRIEKGSLLELCWVLAIGPSVVFNVYLSEINKNSIGSSNNNLSNYFFLNEYVSKILVYCINVILFRIPLWFIV